MNIDYQPWYQTGASLSRCLECGSLVSSADTETHTIWHTKIQHLALGTADSLERVANYMDAHP